MIKIERMGLPICGAFLLLYLIFPAINLNYADDAYQWAFKLQFDDRVINSHHLIFNILAPTYRIFPEIAATTFLSAYAALWGALGLLVLLKIMERLETPSKLMGVVTCGFSAGYWSYSTVGDVYVPTVSCLLVATYFQLQAFAQTGSKRALSIVLSALFSMLAILHHQAFFIFVAGLGLIGIRGLTLKDLTDTSSELFTGIIASTLAGSLCLIAYGSVFHLLAAPSVSFWGFVSGYATNFASYPDMKDFSLTSIVKAVAGFTRALVSTNVLFDIDAFAQAIQSAFPYRHMHYQVFLASTISPVASFVAFISLAISLILVAIVSLKGLLEIRAYPRLVKMTICGVLPQILFFVWWESISDEFWIWTIPFWALLVSAIPNKQIIWRYCTLGLVVSLFFGTLFGTIIPDRSPSANIDWINNEFITEVNPGDLVLSLDEIVITNRIRQIEQEVGFTYISLLNDAAKGRKLDIETIVAQVERTLESGGKIYIGPYLVEPPLSYLRVIELNYPEVKADLVQLAVAIREASAGNLVSIKPKVVVAGYFVPEFLNDSGR